MAWGKKKQNTTAPELSVEEQVVALIEQVLFSEKGIKADKIDSSDAIALNLAQILTDQKDRLSRLFDNDYSKFEQFMLSCVAAAREGYKKFASKIKTSEVELHNALIAEARSVATKFDNHIKTFITTLTAEKVNAINSEKTQADSTQSTKVTELDSKQALLDADLAVQKFVAQYLKSCDTAAASDKIDFMDPNSKIYDKTQLETYITAHASDFDAAVIAAYNALPDDETKNKFAEAVHAQVVTFDNEVNQEGSTASKEKKYADAFTEAESLRAQADQAKQDATQAKTDAEPAIIALVDSVAATAGKTTEMSTEKTKGIIAAIDYAITLAAGNNEMSLELTKKRAEYSGLLNAETLAAKELKLIETRKEIEGIKRTGLLTHAGLMEKIANIQAKGYTS